MYNSFMVLINFADTLQKVSFSPLLFCKQKRDRYLLSQNFALFLIGVYYRYGYLICKYIFLLFVN